jgi:hypothetical protein
MNSAAAYALMESSRSEEEWSANCDKVKASHGGQYPDWWYVSIIMSGLLGRVRKTWPTSPGVMLGSDGR